MNTTLLATVLLTTSAGGSVTPTPPAVDAEPAPIIDIAICLDVSTSMQGLIDAARQRLWSIVSDLASAEPAPDLRLALITFGHNSYEQQRGWVQLDCDLTDDLDLVSQKLFALTIHGGIEYVARAVHVATTELAWREGENPMRVILVAGNESAGQDPMITVEEACSAAAEKGIQINAFFCGPKHHRDAAGWETVAHLADGYFAAIDHNAPVALQPTPFDEELVALNEKINRTYLAYGASGSAGLERQREQDANAGGRSGGGIGGFAERAIAKGSSAYRNSAWDLVDAVRSGAVVLGEIEAEHLPEEMRSMTAQERVLHIEQLQAERTAIRERIRELSALRQANLQRQQMEHRGDDKTTFGRQVRDALRGQAEAKGLRFPADPEISDAENAAESDDTETTGTIMERSQSPDRVPPQSAQRANR